MITHIIAEDMITCALVNSVLFDYMCSSTNCALQPQGVRGSTEKARAEEGKKSMRRQGSRVQRVAAKGAPPRKEEKKSGRGVGEFRPESRGRTQGSGDLHHSHMLLVTFHNTRNVISMWKSSVA